MEKAKRKQRDYDLSEAARELGRVEQTHQARVHELERRLKQTQESLVVAKVKQAESNDDSQVKHHHQQQSVVRYLTPNRRTWGI